MVGGLIKNIFKYERRPKICVIYPAGFNGLGDVLRRNYQDFKSGLVGGGVFGFGKNFSGVLSMVFTAEYPADNQFYK
ncbi:MAG: hypothetical protein HYY55_01595 [Candidatus Niyogibacteria bacterium]|nr:MAG: hypothetical protein HYY55_01595 [Candidatus Niyogibacteria bacterium]